MRFWGKQFDGLMFESKIQCGGGRFEHDLELELAVSITLSRGCVLLIYLVLIKLFTSTYHLNFSIGLRNPNGMCALLMTACAGTSHKKSASE